MSPSTVRGLLSASPPATAIPSFSATTVAPPSIKVEHEVEYGNDDSGAYLTTIDDAVVRSKVEVLCQVFPHARAEELHCTLQCNGENIDDAVEMLLDENAGVSEAENQGETVEHGSKGKNLKRRTEDMVSRAIVHFVV